MDLETLLERNYDELKDPWCKEEVLHYLYQNDSVKDKDALFVKRLTKVASHILQSEDSIETCILERLFYFNQEGARKIREGEIGEIKLNQFSLMKMEAHFYGHAGKVAEAIFKRTGIIAWGGVSYSSFMLAAKKNNDFESGYTCMSYSIAGDVAQDIFKKTGNIEWAKNAYEAKINAAKSVELFDPKHSAYEYGFAGEIAMEMFKSTKDVKLGEKAYYDYMKAADMIKELDQKHSAHCYGFAGDIAKRLFKRTKEKEWAQKAIDCYKQFDDFYRFYSPAIKRRLRKRVKSNIDQLGRQIKV